MPVTLSIKNAPDDIVARLRERAAKNHRSLQGELMAIIEAAAVNKTEEHQYLTPMEVFENIRSLGIHTPSDSVEIIRALRDGDDRS
jgi:plasmid stability protein